MLPLTTTTTTENLESASIPYSILHQVSPSPFARPRLHTPATPPTRLRSRPLKHVTPPTAPASTLTFQGRATRAPASRRLSQEERSRVFVEASSNRHEQHTAPVAAPALCEEPDHLGWPAQGTPARDRLGQALSASRATASLHNINDGARVARLTHPRNRHSRLVISESRRIR